MKLSDFDFDLPEHLIALRPVRPRPALRLLVARGDETHDSIVRDLADWLRPGDMLVFNDTQVIPARLTGERRRASVNGSGVAKIEVTLIHRDGPARWTALARPAKRLAPGERIHFGGGLTAQVAEKREAGEIALNFDRGGANLDAAIAGAGQLGMPAGVRSSLICLRPRANSTLPGALSTFMVKVPPRLGGLAVRLVTPREDVHAVPMGSKAPFRRTKASNR